MNQEFQEFIAIIGVACRFPGANTPEAFWQVLHNGTDTVTKVSKKRWNVDTFYNSEPVTPGKMNTQWGGFLEQIDLFDPSFFGISPREAKHMDPQQRLVLEVTWEALENAGIAPEGLSGSRTGVFMGISSYDYHKVLCNNLSNIEAYSGTGSSNSIAANRLSYILNLRGPSIAIDTACSSSLVALHYGCGSLLAKESNMCLVGGVNLILSPDLTITFSQARMLSSDGRCKTFDASADGYVRGEGCGVVVLKRLSDALRDGDNIQAIIKGSAVNQDGLTHGITAPNGPSQQVVIHEALEKAGVKPAQISYVETHGTGTILGDPIEVNSLKTVLMKGRDVNQSCYIGSVKSNIGHLEAAAGIAGLIKVVLSLQHEEIPPHLHFKQLNPYIKLNKTPIKIPTSLQKWPAIAQPRLAGVSSFGFGGTNAHVVLEEAPFKVKEQKGKQTGSVANESQEFVKRPYHILTLSAKCDRALQELVQKYKEFLVHNPTVAIADICFTANTGRSHFDHRLAVVATSGEQLHQQLKAVGTGISNSGLVRAQLTGKKRHKMAFLFTGQGSQYINMGRELYSTQPIFRKTLEKCDLILSSYLDRPLLNILYPQPDENSPIDRTAYTQVAIFALEYALFELWKSWGVEPDVVMGHSVGEYVAATVAGVFSLEDGLKLVANRGRLMQALPPNGKMMAVMACPDKVNQLIAPYIGKVAIAAINGPQSVVISGEVEAIRTICERLDRDQIKTKHLQVSHAFHSPLMEPIMASFEAVASEITYNQPRISIISNVTGEQAQEDIATPQYWVNHLREPVKFACGMETLKKIGCEIFLEIGSKPILLGMGRQCSTKNTGVWLPSLRPGYSEWQQMLQSLAKLYLRGVPVSWSDFHRDYSCNKVALPTYPFQRQRYWIEGDENESQKAIYSNPEHKTTTIENWLNNGNIQQLTQELEKTERLSPEQVELLPELLELLVKKHRTQSTTATIKDWFYQVEWKPLLNTQLPNTQLPDTPTKTSIQPSHWLIFADSTGVGQVLATHLEEQGHQCTLVYATDAYKILETGIYSLNPCKLEEFELLFQEVLKNSELPSKRIIHLWSLDAVTSRELNINTLEQSQRKGCGSVLYLLQALVKQNLSTSPRLWLITRGAQPVKPQTDSVEVTQAPIWGLGKVVALEHPQIWGGMVDLNPLAPEGEVEMLLTQIQHTHEDHLAFRQGQLYAPRLLKQFLKPSETFVLKDHSTYLITGGFGALGLQVGKWMVEQGAKHLVLIGRRKPSDKAIEVIRQLEQQGTQVLILQGDVSKPQDVTQILEIIDSSAPPLKGIIHAAGVLDDGLLQQMSWESLQKVMAPKVEGAWNLHTLTQTCSLDFFVCFSSVASLLGSPGQGNYACANAFMDALIHHRHAMSLPGLSINWGPWAEVGMAVNSDSCHHNRMATMGINSLTLEQGLNVTGYLLGQSLAQVGVLPVDWSVFLSQFSRSNQTSLLCELLKETESQDKNKPINKKQNEPLKQIKAASAKEREKILIAYFQNEISQVLRAEDSQIDAQQPLNTMGLDSLMAVELRNRLQTDLEVDVPIVKFIENINIVDLSVLVNEQLILIENNQRFGQKNNEQLALSKVNNNWIEGEL